MTSRLDEAGIAVAAEHLAAADPALASLIDRNGPPPLWRREPGFASMIRLILEQQVSLASADAAFRRLEDALGTVAPAAFLALDDEQLRAIGFSRQKAGYSRGIAEGMIGGTIDLQRLDALADNEVIEALETIKGVGPWTASNYLLFVLGRPDAWPTGDRAVYVSMASVLDLGDVPDRETGDEIAEKWRPYRAVAARLLWHEYLGGGPVPAPNR